MHAFQNCGAKPYFLERAKTLTPAQVASFIESVDESQYSLNEWCQALLEFETWAEQNHRSLKLPAQIEYLTCCVQGTQNEGRLLSLSIVLDQYLKSYGVA